MPRGYRLLLYSALVVSIVTPTLAHAQAAGAGKIIGNIRVSPGNVPDHLVLVSLETRGSVIADTYSDTTGRFGFSDLIGNPYKITVNDDAYQPFSLAVDVNPANSQMNFVQVTLIPRANAQKDSLSARVPGSNPDLVSKADYTRQFPKKTLKEFDKGVDADHKGEPDEAIEHYKKSLSYSPDFYPAHNNLGSIYLSRKDFEEAQKQFEAAVNTNQSDAQAYFNLANVCMLQNQFQDAQNYLDNGFRRQPESPMGKFLLGTLDIRTGKLSEAQVALEQAIHIDPAMAQPRLQLINLYLKEGKTTDAINQLHAFLVAIPSSPFSTPVKQMLHRLESSASQAGVVSSAPKN